MRCELRPISNHLDRLTILVMILKFPRQLPPILMILEMHIFKLKNLPLFEVDLHHGVLLADGSAALFTNILVLVGAPTNQSH